VSDHNANDPIVNHIMARTSYISLLWR